MTASTAPTLLPAATSSDPGFWATLDSEWTKLRSVRSTWIIVTLAIGLSIGFSALIALISGLTHESWGAEVRDAFDPVLTTNSGSLFGCIFLIVLGVTVVTSEYSSGMIRTTFICNPWRMQVLAGKTVVVALLGLTITTITIPGMFLVSQPIFRYHGLETASITDSATYQTLLTIMLTQGLIYTLVPFGIAWLLRGSASAITASIGFLWLPWMIGPLVPVWVQENVFRYLPDIAANSLSGITQADAPQYLSQIPAIIVVVSWIAVSIVISSLVLNRRDV